MTGTGAPIEMVWANGVMKPISPYWLRRAEKEFDEGCVYRIVDQPERSIRSHQHFFASMHDAWANLPPLMAERFPSDEHFRKYCLVKSGHCYSDSITCPSHADAMRVAAFVRGHDEFAVVTVSKNVVTRFTPKSQNYKAMSKEEFQQSKDDCLRVAAEMIDVSKTELVASGRAA